MNDSLRDEYMAKHPDFPWLSANNSGSVAEFMAERGWLKPGESIEDSAKAGEGNMNLTLRIRTGQRSLILKQARPWVEKYDFIPAPWDRALVEARFYERTASIPAVSARMPALLEHDPQARALLLEDAGTQGDFADLYRGGFVAEAELVSLGEYLAALHHQTHGAPDPEFANRDMRELNHQHIFQVPLDPDNGLDLDNFEPGLKSVALKLQSDSAYCDCVIETGKRYLEDGPCLVHGDFFPGSWLRTARGVNIIDGEFCFYGDPAVDIGIALAHFALARRPTVDAEVFLGAYGHPAAESLCQDEWIGRFAGVEVMRRLIGVAQLPIAPTDGFRAHLLERSRNAMMRGDWKELFT